MILASVHYEVFPGEAEALEADTRRTWHQIEGELRLEFTDAPAQFISWGNGPVLYAVEVRDDSFFDEYMLGSVEMTDHPYWCELIGCELQLAYADADHQVLAITSAAGRLFLSSQHVDGTFQGDSLRISPHPPAERVAVFPRADGAVQAA